jgi:hypothetical protein
MKILLSSTVFVLIAAASTWGYLYAADFSTKHILAECSGESNAFKALCYTNHINDTLAHRGVSAAFDLLAAAYVADPDVKGFCHGNTHDIGKMAYDIYKTKGVLDISQNASYCGFGFYHGIMEQMFAETGSLADAKTFCSHVNSVLGTNQAYAEGSCYHGIGHGVTDGSDPSAWGDVQKMMEPGLRLCRQIADTSELEMRCASGVFNSIAIMYRDPKYRLGTPANPYALCTSASLNSEEKRACYDQMNTLVYFILPQQDIAKALSYAEAISDPVYRTQAIQGVASAAGAQSSPATRDTAALACRALSGSGDEACVRGLLAGIMEFGTPGSEYQDGLSFCSMTALEGGERKICFDEMVIYAQGVYPLSLQQTICRAIPKADRPAQCERAIGVASTASLIVL